MLKNNHGSVKTMLSLAILAVTLIFFFSSYNYVNTLRSVGVDYETRLSAQYLSNQNMLSEYVSGFYEMVGVADLKSEKMDQIIKNAVEGRYGEDGFSANGAFFSAISEAYPDLAGLDIYDKIVDYVKAKRAEYKATQDKILDMLRGYDNWRADGIFQHQIISGVLGIPTDRLQAKISDKTFHGEAALEKMRQIVLTDQAIDAYDTGRMAPLKVK